MNLDFLGEFGLISRLAGNLDQERPEVLVGIGDDAAVLETGGGELLLLTCDAQIQDVHFRVDWSAPDQVGRRAASVNLSDIAAMGGEPTFALISLQVPINTDVSFLDGLYSGLNSAFGEFGAQVVGGNTASHPDRIAVDVTLLGKVHPGNLLLRSGAKPGDVLCVTGELGASAAGLTILKKNESGLIDGLEGAKTAYLEPTPRVAEGLFLGKTGEITSCIDLSDGLLGDAGHIAERSGVVVSIDLDRVPVSESAKNIAHKTGQNALDFALKGGEDFELLFTVKPERSEKIVDELEKKTGTVATIIGEISGGESGVRLESKGKEVKALGGSYDHFRGLLHSD